MCCIDIMLYLKIISSVFLMEQLSLLPFHQWQLRDRVITPDGFPGEVVQVWPGHDHFVVSTDFIPPGCRWTDPLPVYESWQLTPEK